jgi:hypothetical protein
MMAHPSRPQSSAAPVAHPAATSLGAGASGDVGVLGDEHAQRLVGIFGEAALHCLEQLRRMSEKQDPARVGRLYAAGLATVPRWNSDIIAEEVARMLVAYPEAEMLLQYCFACVASEMGTGSLRTLPTLAEGYRMFLSRVATSPDTQAPSFVTQAHVLRRGVFVEALRMSLHDLYRRVEPSLTHAAARIAVDAVRSTSERPPAAQATEPDRQPRGGGSSALREALLQEQAQQQTPVSSAPPSLAPPESVRSVRIEGPCFF